MREFQDRYKKLDGRTGTKLRRCHCRDGSRRRSLPLVAPKNGHGPFRIVAASLCGQRLLATGTHFRSPRYDDSVKLKDWGYAMTLGTILLILLVLLLIGGLPSWPYSKSWGYGPSGLFGLVLVIVVILVLTNRI